MSESHSLSIRARKKVKAQLEKAEKERTLALFQKRMELARTGALAFKAGKLKESAQAYYSYLDISERSKEVKQGGLTPQNFDPKRDIAELLLLSGVFWDLAKLHDRISKKDTAKLKHFLEKFVLFSKGMPFQYISSELVRKYLVNGLPVHRSEFQDTHVKLGGGRCFIATALQDQCEPGTLASLRAFRDEKLLENFAGKIFVKIYYALGPSLAGWVLKAPPQFQKKIAEGLDRFSKRWR